MITVSEQGLVMASINMKNVSLHFVNEKAAKKSVRLSRVMNLRRNFDNHYLFKDLNITLSPGDRVLVVGKPGSGKSTLLRLMAGAAPPSSGKVDINGSIYTQIDSQFVYHTATAMQNIILNAYRLGYKKDKLLAFKKEFRQLFTKKAYYEKTLIEMPAHIRNEFVHTLDRILLANNSIFILDRQGAKKNVDYLFEREEGKDSIIVLATKNPVPFLNKCNKLIDIDTLKITE